MGRDIWQQKGVSEAGLPEAAGAIMQALGRDTPFILALDGGMGAGKTALTRAMLRVLGLPSIEPVTSPTYTLMNEYEIAGRWYAHLDLYRVGAHFSLAELGVLDARPFQGVFVEWASTPAVSERLDCTHRLSIVVVSPELRDLSLEET